MDIVIISSRAMKLWSTLDGWEIDQGGLGVVEWCCLVSQDNNNGEGSPPSLQLRSIYWRTADEAVGYAVLARRGKVMISDEFEVGELE